MWGALQAGPLWGYEPLPLLAPSDSNPRSLRDSEKGSIEVTLPVKRWSLAPTEGPERARIRLHQEFEPLSVLGKDGMVTQIARKGDTASSKTPQGLMPESAPYGESIDCWILNLNCLTHNGLNLTVGLSVERLGILSCLLSHLGLCGSSSSSSAGR